MDDGNWIKLNRKYLTSKIFSNPITNQVFIWLLLKAQHKQYHHSTNSFGVITLKPGQICISSEYLAEILGKTRQNIRTALKAIKSTGAITSESTKGITVITLVKWEDYQGQKHKLTSEVTSELTKGQPGPNQALTTEQECKNERMKENKEADECYMLYPNKRENGTSTGKSLKDKIKIETILKKGYPLKAAIEFHKKTAGGFFKNLGTFLNNLPDPNLINEKPEKPRLSI